jgi:hypothetical protein
MFIIHFTTIWLIAALIVIGTWSSEASRAENASIRLKDNYNTGSVRALLKPPNTPSPRTTLKSFIENMVPEYSQKFKGQVQYPYTFSKGQDFPVGVIKK